MYSRFALYIPIVLLLSLAGVLWAQEGKRLTSEDRKKADTVVARLASCAATEIEKSLVEETKVRLDTLFFLRGTKAESRKALKALEKGKEALMIAKGLVHKDVYNGPEKLDK